MGARALVTYLEETPGSSLQMGACEGTTYYTHWGASNLRLYHDITPDDPMPDGLDEDPYVDDATVEEIATDHLDYLHHEAYFVVDAEYNVTPFRTLWYELTDLQSYLLGARGYRTTRMPEDGWRTTGFGALVEPRILPEYSEDGSDYICDYDGTRFKGAKDGIEALAIHAGVGEDDALHVLNEWVYNAFERNHKKVPAFSPYGKWHDEAPYGALSADELEKSHDE